MAQGMRSPRHAPLAMILGLPRALGCALPWMHAAMGVLCLKCTALGALCPGHERLGCVAPGLRALGSAQSEHMQLGHATMGSRNPERMCDSWRVCVSSVCNLWRTEDPRC